MGAQADLNESRRFKHAERFANGDSAHSQLLAQATLIRETVTWVEASVLDESLDLIDDDVRGPIHVHLGEPRRKGGVFHLGHLPSPY
jgi:hypothetical protein